MKIREGFVSNSSSSSFLIQFKRQGDCYLTEDQENKLVSYGFTKTFAMSPECYGIGEPDDVTEEAEKIWGWVNYGYDVTVNQADVIYFLLKNNIGFHANCHYGDHDVYYDQDSDSMYKIQNIGRQAGELRRNASFYFDKDLKDCSFDDLKQQFDAGKREWFEKIDVKEWLEREEKWQREFEETVEKGTTRRC
jgi:hypothetical protein